MKKVKVILAAMAVVALVAASGQAALISQYTMDDTLANNISGAPDGTMSGTSTTETYVTGVIGNAIDLDGIDQCVDPTTGMLPSAGQLVGTVSVWINTVDDQTATAWVHGRGYGGTSSTTTISAFGNVDGTRGKWRYYYRANDGSTFIMNTTAGSEAYRDGQWHQLIYTYNIDLESSANSTGVIYFDGVAQTMTVTQSMTTNETFTPWTLTALGADNGNTSRSKWVDTSLDDVSVWDEDMSEGEAKALYNAAKSDLNYAANDVETLFGVADSGTADQTGDGLVWQRVTGLTGDAGSVSKSGDTWTVQLDGGIGVQAVIPEPGTLVLVISAAMGLLVFAWRRK